MFTLTDGGVLEDHQIMLLVKIFIKFKLFRFSDFTTKYCKKTDPFWACILNELGLSRETISVWVNHKSKFLRDEMYELNEICPITLALSEKIAFFSNTITYNQLMSLLFMSQKPNFDLLLSLLGSEREVPFDIFQSNATPYLFNPGDEYRELLKKNLATQPFSKWAAFDSVINNEITFDKQSAEHVRKAVDAALLQLKSKEKRVSGPPPLYRTS